MFIKSDIDVFTLKKNPLTYTLKQKALAYITFKAH